MGFSGLEHLSGHSKRLVAWERGRCSIACWISGQLLRPSLGLLGVGRHAADDWGPIRTPGHSAAPVIDPAWPAADCSGGYQELPPPCGLKANPGREDVKPTDFVTLALAALQQPLWAAPGLQRSPEPGAAYRGCRRDGDRWRPEATSVVRRAPLKSPSNNNSTEI